VGALLLAAVPAAARLIRGVGAILVQVPNKLRDTNVKNDSVGCDLGGITTRTVRSVIGSDLEAD
jgi:hypothetical protein